jgi:alkaline phosphatase D
MRRRDFLSDLSCAALLCAAAPNDWRVLTRPRFVDDPFTLGVASGDPTATGAVLWTRLAPRPFELDGGMIGARPSIVWELADDDGFTKVVRRGRYTAAPELGYSVHVEVEGLAPDRWYFYRFISGDATSPVGRVRTTPADGALTPLRLGVASCQNYEQGLYTALDHLSREQCDLVTHLGDYIYEGGANATLVRAHHGVEVRTVEQYRERYSQYKLDPMLQAAHRMCPWIVIWDDHEVDNNYAGDVGENVMESAEQMRLRRAAAYQAWWEHQPVRVPRARSWADLEIRRTTDWGALARFWMLDTRQYRDDQACGDGGKVVPCGDWADPARTMMGAQQERWLFDGLATSRARWQVLGQQVPIAPFDDAVGPETRLYMDGWSGYPAARDRLLGAITEHAANRTVALAGDVHANFVNELHAGFDRPDRPTVAAEFVGTSISSGWDGDDHWGSVPAALPENPHVKWHSARRGYMICEVGADDWTTSYREVAYVTRPGAPVTTPTRWRVVHGQPGITRA